MKTAFLILFTFGAFGFLLNETILAATSEGRAGDALGWKIEYNDADLITRIIDPAGRATRIEYDFGEAERLRRLVVTKVNEAAVIREFDDRGRLSSMTDSMGSVAYGYDDLDRLSRVQREGNSAIIYTYDTLDRITTIQIGDFYRIEYTYDFLGRLVSMETPAGAVRYDYLTGQGQVVRTLPNGLKTIWKYSTGGNLRQITHGLAPSPDDNRYTVLARYTYQYRPNGLIKAIKEETGAGVFLRGYEYDEVGRLVRAKGPSRQQYAYAYDTVGNRVKTLSTRQAPQALTYDWASRLTSANGTPVIHDAAGNLTAMTPDLKPMRYRYNQANQLVEVLGAKVAYQYDGDGQLIQRRAGRTEITFIPNPLSAYWQPLVMEDNTGQRTVIIWEGTTPLMMIRESKPEFLLHDHLGSVRMVVDRRGRVTRRIDYEPFGTMTEVAEEKEFAPRFAGLFWEPAGEVYLTRARAYQPSFARFLQIDPKHRISYGSQKDISGYGYCGGDPVNYRDLDGAIPIRAETSYDDRWSASPIPKVRNNRVSFPELRDHWESKIKNNMVEAGVELGKLLRDGFAAPELDTALYFKSGLDLFSDLPDYYNYSKIHSGDPASAAMSLSLGLKSVGIIIPNPVTGGMANLIDTGVAVGQAVRGRIIQNRAINLIEFPFDYRVRPSVTQEIHRDWGRFAMKSDNNAFSARGGWSLRHDRGRSYSAAWAIQRMNSYRNHAGARIDRIVRAAESRIESSNYSWRERTRYTSGREVFSGSAISKAVDEFNRTGIYDPGKWEHRLGVSHDFRGGEVGSSWDRPGSYSDVSPSRVGGIRLHEAGRALEGLGLIKGITLDANNNLLLLDQTGEAIDLPPLRLDDIVTVFRSVYLYGEGPTVTIDPNPENPEGSAMIIRHSKATEDTYVGWVLFQADRLMKGYTLGADNETAKDISSHVAGYDKVLKTLYFGRNSPQDWRPQGHWERFWIVPARASRFAGARQALTLFDVPLKVKTQTMKWENGELVDDPDGKSSPGALAFTDWFTANYDQIAGERFLTPPPESGLTEPVPIFTELRRIALMTAIAEKLRDQGVPMPFWMRDYEVRSVPFEHFTPGLVVERSNQRTIARVFGGVGLSAEDKVVQNFVPHSNLAELPRQERILVREKIALADSLEDVFRDELSTMEPLEVRQFRHAGDEYRAAALPGAETQALAPARLAEVDLSVPVDGGAVVQLVRRYNSFFDPVGPWGEGWTLDLPRLETVRVPVSRKEAEVHYRTVYELITPLNSIYARFSRIENVPAFNDTRLLVSDQPSDFYGLADGEPTFLSGPTHNLIRKDGGVWHFSKPGGHLVATEAGGLRTVYERDGDGRLTRIVGLRGRQPVAFIEMTYDASGKLESATARKTAPRAAQSTVNYSYDADGRLAAVTSESGRLGYRYQGAWVTVITYGSVDTEGNADDDDTLTRHFEYDARGQLLSEIATDGTRTDYRVSAGVAGNTLTVTQPGGAGGTQTVRYDPAFRPLEARYPDGSQAAWRYPAEGGMVLEVAEPEGASIAQLTESADGRHRTLELDDRYRVAGEFDAAGRLISLAENGRTVLEQDWLPDGRLRVAGNETQAEHFEYDADGLLSRVLLTPPDEQGQFTRWQETRLDPAGRPVEVKDFRGLHQSMGYDDTGVLARMTVHRNGKTYGYKLIRDDTGRLNRVQSSWGTQRYTYDKDGQLATAQMDKAGKSASAEWESGQLRKITQFDGGTFSLSYFEEGDHAGLLKQLTTPNRLTLGYRYDPAGRLAEVDVGDQSRMRLDYDAEGRLTGWLYRAAGR